MQSLLVIAETKRRCLTADYWQRNQIARRSHFGTRTHRPLFSSSGQGNDGSRSAYYLRCNIHNVLSSLSSELNDKITTFLESYGRMMSREQWVLAYTTAKETAGASSASPRPSSDVASKDSAEKTAATGWVWDEKVQKYRYWDGQKWVWQ